MVSGIKFAPVAKKSMKLDDEIFFIFSKVASFKVWP